MSMQQNGFAGGSSQGHSGGPSAENSHTHVHRQSYVGSLHEDVPQYVSFPPIEAVTFGWGVNEDGQLV